MTYLVVNADDPAAREYLTTGQIRLVNFVEAMALFAGTPQEKGRA